MRRREFLKAAVLCRAAMPARASAAPIPLGKLEPFWRASAALGPFLESGVGLMEIPEYLLRGDFAYRKRPHAREVPFADHLSVVRLLGGYDDGSSRGKPDPAVRGRDLAYRDTAGRIRYRMELLRPRLAPYLDNGYTSLTLVLDNVPWCFPERPGTAQFGQCSPPRDPGEWRAFIAEVCRELVKIMGRETALHLRFRVGTENNGRERFNGSQAEYLRHYEATVAGIREVLPRAQVGPFNISGASVAGISRANVNAFALAEYCAQRSLPFDFVAFSRYYRPGDDPRVQHAEVCREVWEEFERRVPRLRGVSREIHEFGSAPWGEAGKGVFASAEPGALGGALLCHMMFGLRAARIRRLWHWNTFDRFRSRAGELMSLPFSNAWVYSVADRMAGGESYLLPALERSRSGAQHMAVASVLENRTLILIAAYDPEIARHQMEIQHFPLPRGLPGRAPRARAVRLSRETSIYDRIRADLASSALLSKDFLSRPERCGSVREMGARREAEFLVAERASEYIRMWENSLTLRPAELELAEQTLTVRLSAPEVLAIEIA